MAERRQAHRREPIIVEIRGEDVEVHPLPWTQRNDLGNALIVQYTDMLNSTMKSYVDPDTSAPQLSMYLNDKLSDPLALINLGIPELEVKDEWEYPELYELIYAILDVNDLGHLKHLADPNSLTPMNDGGASSSGMEKRVLDIQNQLSSPDSESSDSETETSGNLPIPKSSTSLESGTDSSGTSDGGSSL